MTDVPTRPEPYEATASPLIPADKRPAWADDITALDPAILADARAIVAYLRRQITRDIPEPLAMQGIINNTGTTSADNAIRVYEAMLRARAEHVTMLADLIRALNDPRHDDA